MNWFAGQKWGWIPTSGSRPKGVWFRSLPPALICIRIKLSSLSQAWQWPVANASCWRNKTEINLASTWMEVGPKEKSFILIKPYSFFKNFVHFSLHWSSLLHAAFLLLQSTGSRVRGLQQWWHSGWVAPHHTGSSHTRDWNCPQHGQPVLNHWTSREVLLIF